MEERIQLEEYMRRRAAGGICVAFSGGVDSAVVLKAACGAGGVIHAVTGYTPFHSPLEPVEARRMAQGMGARFHLVQPPLPPELLQNPANRCYLCKKALFTHFWNLAREQGLGSLLDGTNTDDRGVYRPGLRALGELGVGSPLAELGFSKAQVRRLAGEMGLEAARKPSAPCLATRFPYGTPINLELLPRVDELERYVRSLGPQIVRARIHGGSVRLEVPAADFLTVLASGREITAKARELGFLYTALDLLGFRSGSMDEALEV